ncbi:MAG TPA: hypothetical protein VIV14_03570 [Gammaproteobacteria bacterium]
MIASAMLFGGAAILAGWGAAHILIPTRNIIDGFGPLTVENRRILLMEWLMEGVLLIFLGLLVALVRAFAPEDELTPLVVYRTSAAVLVVMAGISLATGARSKIGPMRMCPLIFISAALLFWLPTVFRP